MAYSDPSMQQNATVSHIESGAADVYVLKTDLLKEYPQLLPTYFKQGGKQFTTMEMLNIFGFGRLTKSASHNPYTQHYEKPIVKDLVHVGSITSGLQSDESVITLDASDMFTVNNGAGNTYQKSRPRKTETLDIGIAGLRFRITDKDTTVNPNTITIKSSDGSNPQDVISAGSVLNIIGTLSGEFTGQPAPLQPLRYKYQNTFAITKETDLISGSNLTTKVAFNVVPGSNLLYMEGIDDMEDRHRLQKGKIWMFGSTSDNWSEYSTVLDENVPILGTEGLYDAVTTSGYNHNFDEATYGINDVRALSNYYQRIQLSTTNILLLQGMTNYQLLYDSVRDQVNYNWVVGVSDEFIMNRVKKNNWGEGMNKEYNAEGMMINLGLSGFTDSGYTYMLKGCPEFNNSYGAGAVGDYLKTAIACPIGYARDAEHTPYTGYEYRGTDGYSRENEVWFKTGAGNKGVVGGKADFIKTSQYDGVQYFLRSEIAPHFSLLNQFAILKPGATS